MSAERSNPISAMKHRLDNTDSKLTDVLRSWRVDEPLPPRFQERVWKRIEAAEAPARREPIAWLTVLFLRPAFATVVAALLLFAGVTAGYLRSDRDTALWDKQLSHQYVAAMNPYANEDR